ncbi:hypothetical protein TEK04_01300 [Klenkia sp. LSe6-5]|uniref:Uncharacterized protein n=1 Tax=Klenkia sesuvii TaxID=3103137 RepID=A0ABU8DPJ1_9ACTN
MRLTTPLKTVVAGSAALALLTACGGGSDDSTASSPSSAASSSAADEGAEATDPAAAEFCADAEAAFSELDGVTGTTDPSALPSIFAQASDQLSSIEPPAEIADSWGTLTDTLAQAVQDVQGLDLTTPEGQQAFTEAFSGLEDTASAAQEEVSAYVDANCDLPTGSAPATS